MHCSIDLIDKLTEVIFSEVAYCYNSLPSLLVKQLSDF